MPASSSARAATGAFTGAHHTAGEYRTGAMLGRRGVMFLMSSSRSVKLAVSGRRAAAIVLHDGR
jgi:hypothetical protein